jgi:hypothetical protein
MQTRIRRRHEAHTRANNVCIEHRAVFDTTSGGQRTRAALGTCVANVDRLLVVQERSTAQRRAATEQLRAARTALRIAAKAVVTVGRLTSVDDATLRTIRLPGRLSDEALLAYGRGLLDVVSAHADAFASLGLPVDVGAKLARAIQRIVSARNVRAASIQRFAAAAQSIRAAQHTADQTAAALAAVAEITPAATPEVVIKLRVAMRVGGRAAAETTAAPTPATSALAPSFPAPGHAAALTDLRRLRCVRSVRLPPPPKASADLAKSG